MNSGKKMKRKSEKTLSVMTLLISYVAFIAQIMLFDRLGFFRSELQYISIFVAVIVAKLTVLRDTALSLKSYILYILGTVFLLGLAGVYEIATYEIWRENSLFTSVYRVLLLGGILFFPYTQALSQGQFQPPSKKLKLGSVIIWIIGIGVYCAVMTYMQRFNGNFQDEMWHMIAAKSIVSGDGLPVLNSWSSVGYTRGLPVTLIVAGIFQIFGISNEVAKIAPFLLGLVSLIGFIYIAHKILFTQFARWYAVLIYVISPWLIFNAFYIRGYIFLQASLMTIVALSIFTHESLGKRQWIRSFLGVMIMTAITYINYFHLYDATYLLIPVVYISTLGTVFLVSFPRDILSTRNKLQLFLGIGVLGLLVGSLELNYISLLSQLLGGAETNNVGTHIGFNEFFLLRSPLFTYLSVLIILFWKKLQGKQLVFLFVTFPIVLLHFLSDYSLQLMRGLVYIVPIFLLLASLGLDKVLVLTRGRQLKVPILICVIVVSSLYTARDFREIFIAGYPVFPREIGYLEFEQTYTYIKENLSDAILISVEYTNQQASFWDVNFVYNIDFTEEILNTLPFYQLHYVDSEDILRQYYTNTPVIQDEQEFKDLVEIDSNPRVCLVTQPFSNRFLTPEMELYIEEHFVTEANFASLEIQCEKLELESPNLED